MRIYGIKTFFNNILNQVIVLDEAWAVMGRDNAVPDITAIYIST
jgi:hypothetical protein